MTENVENQNEDDSIEIDPDHPWIMAAMAFSPEPGRASAQLVPVLLPAPTEDNPERVLNAAMLTTVSESAVQTVFMPPAGLVDLTNQISACFEYWDQKKEEPKLIIADKGMQHAAQQKADMDLQAARIIKGK